MFVIDDNRANGTNICDTPMAIVVTLRQKRTIK